MSAILVELIQQIAKNQMEAEKPAQLTFGTVISERDEPLRIRLSDKIILEESQIVRVSSGAFEKGAMLVLMRDLGGQRYYVLNDTDTAYVLSSITHVRLKGRDESDQHPIKAIEQLQDNLDQRLLRQFLTNTDIDAIMNL